MKKLISILTLSACAAGLAFDATARYRGDLNGDDRVDLADMVHLAKAIKAGSTDKSFDVNASGKVDDYDLQKLADIIISGKLTDDSGMNVGIGGWEDDGEDFGGTLKAPAFTTRSAEDTGFYMRNPKSDGIGHYSMEFGLFEGTEAPAAILFNIRLPSNMIFDENDIVELEPSILANHKLYGKPRSYKEREDDDWCDCELRFIVFSPDLTALPIIKGKLGNIRYSLDEDRWCLNMFQSCQIATAGGNDIVTLPDHWNGDDLFRPIEISSIWLDQTDIQLKEGEKSRLSASIDPSYATGQDLVWSSSDVTVASVYSEDGLNAVITALKEGEAVVTANASNGVKASCMVHVKPNIVEVSNIYLNKNNLTMIEGEETTLMATISPQNATDQYIDWHSSDVDIAIVIGKGREGVVTALRPGYVEICAEASNGLMAVCAINIEKKIVEVTSVSLDQSKLNLTEGETATLTATINPSDATDKTLTWTSTDASVASVSSNGEVKALKPGTATITAISSNGKTATCTVTVAMRIIDVTAIVLSNTDLKLTEGESATLTAIIQPADATDKTLTWTSSDNSIATVSAVGEVKALNSGTATVTVSASNGISASCNVTVESGIVAVTEVKLDKSSLEMTEGDTAILTATINPTDATDKTLTWTSSDASVVSVSSNGEVSALKPGTATIIVSSSNDKTATCTVTVTKRIIDVIGIALSDTELKLTEGESATLTAIIQPADATDKTLTWKSSDASIASVSANGEVKALKAGTATITVSAANGISASCKVTVESGVVAVTEVKLDKTTLEMTEGDTATLTATVNPSDATDKTLTWTSSDTSVASVSPDGEVKALKPGTATITVSSSNGKTAYCVVTVNAKEIEMEAIILDAEELALEIGDTHQFSAIVLPAETTHPELEWWSDDEGVAKVEGSGLVTMMGEGSTIVHVRSVRWPEIEATCRINVTDAVEGIIADEIPCDIYTSNGQLLKKAVPPSEIQHLDRGIYIIRQGGKTIKLLK